MRQAWTSTCLQGIAGIEAVRWNRLQTKMCLADNSCRRFPCRPPSVSNTCPKCTGCTWLPKTRLSRGSRCPFRTANTCYPTSDL